METSNSPKMEIIKKRLEKTAQALKRNCMEAVIVADKNAALEQLRSYLTPGCIIGCGGSVTLDEIGAKALFRDPAYRFIDRYQPDLNEAQRRDLFRQALTADVFVSGTNAVTENGELYNVDGNGNRVAPMIFGPDSVVIVAGYNKVVADLHEAEMRVKRITAPTNATRLHCDTYCARTGYCNALRTDLFEPGMCGGCHTPSRICCDYVVLAQQRVRGRIKVILVAEELGY